ncbi:MAG: hypothetical protein IT553_05070 [Sphingomonadaceae bacterium]|nr:hypothetical protein [Sphingomonadaceae bacterium]
MAAIDDARALHSRSGQTGIREIVWVPKSVGTLACELAALKMARKVDRFRPSAKLKIEPWLVEVALQRLGQRQLTIEEQREVYAATRTPWKVNWPKWWVVRS